MNSEQLNGEGGMGTVPVGVAANIEADFAQELAVETQHSFVVVNEVDPDIDDEAVGLEPCISDP
jgi:hypothetical protein